ncbi:MAG: FMN-binding protein [Candidatus Omnitrophica bacterium]|nr:FMN-binding protein [Candidatus Omnitrophota bacterium]
MRLNFKNEQAVYFLVLIFFIFFQLDNSFSMTLLTEQEAIHIICEKTHIQEMMRKEIITFSPEQMARVKEKLGGRLTMYKKGKDAKQLSLQTAFAFYFCGCWQEKGEKYAALMLEEPGKWGPIKYFIVINNEDKSINNVLVMSYKEIRGRPIVRRSFLSQFIGKKIQDSFKDITGVSGATISSQATVFVVRKALALYSEYLESIEGRKE